MYKLLADAIIPQAVILNMYCTALGIARNLGPLGIPVVGISSSEAAPGHFSKYSHSLIGPDSRDEPEKLLDFLVEIGRYQKTKSVLFPTRDEDVLFIDRFRTELEEFYLIPQAGHEVLDLIMNKDRLAHAAEEAGVGSPKTFRISSVKELEEKRTEIAFPAVVKAVYAYQWHLPEVWQAVGKMKAIKVDSFSELMDIYLRVSPHLNEILVQEWISGPDDQFFIFGAYFNRNSECLGSITAQKILQYPPNFGLGCIVKSIENDEIRSLGIRLLKSLRFSGIAEVEFKRDSRTGKYRLIEINPRHWDQHTLATACGVNLSYIAYLDLCGKQDSLPCVSQRTGVYWVRGGGIVGSLKEDLKNWKFDFGKIQAMLPFGRKVYAVLDWRDVAPFCRMVTQSFLKKVASLGRGR